MTNKYIAIEGVIGVGKTTLARLLQPRYDASILLEVVEDNPFLSEFYQDRQRFAFQTQIFFLLSRYHQQYQAIPAALRRGHLISDYTFAKDELFAWLNLKDDELAMYGRVHAALGEKIPRPDLIVYLRADHDVLMHRIALRDRPFERDMDPDYIREVAAAYDAWLSRLTDIPVLTIETDDLNYLSRPADREHIARLITEALENAAPKPAGPIDLRLESLQQGRVAAFQQFHRDLDVAKGFDGDLFFNYLFLVEEMGELATDLVKIWAESKRRLVNGRGPAESLEEAIEQNRPALRGELADLLAFILKLANYTGIDLEQAYVEKMRVNAGRTWTAERGAADPSQTS
ncbi:MAG: deoxynucleoside kinase [Anaerolineae bacterium]|uniref:deoxynucleoside kinase n=1 Tax=Promineifilum sp. TaxID=2664178 RepID=UPI001DD3AA5E|nr:deoxynucleoside kinase [Anaerolineales bacterium]MCO5179616.1 deoxynucleoside kinase [Promineifilum sp.]MCW5846744.1 deoxynucleoside kinase [Anaerolineae bacterium]